MHTNERPLRRSRRDDGSILLMVIAFTAVAGITIVAILAFAGTVFRNRPPLDSRSRTSESAESAIRMAVTMQRDMGPSGCFNGAGTTLLPPSASFNDVDIEFTCTELSGPGDYVESGRGRFGLITTAHSVDPALAGIQGSSNPGAPIKEIFGDVLLNGGDFDAPWVEDIGVRDVLGGSTFVSGTTPTADRYRVTGIDVACDNPLTSTLDAFPDYTSPADGNFQSHTHNCTSDPWWTLAGDDWGSGTRTYPILPQLPTFLRSPLPNELANGCQVLYPGRYTSPVVLDGSVGTGEYYLASGVYYFTEELSVINGARVIGGEGTWANGCFDADAAFDRYGVWSPKNHEITGAGATLLFGGDGKLVVTDATMYLNRRVSTPATRGSEATSIRSVNFGSKGDVEIPADEVQIGEYPLGPTGVPDPELRAPGSTVLAVDHEITVNSSTYDYDESTLDNTDDIIEYTSTGPSSGLRFDGYVFVPNAGIDITTGSSTNYEVGFSAGIVAAKVRLAVDALPSNVADDFVFGSIDKPLQRRVQIEAKVTASDGFVARSNAVVQVHADGSYAINSWGVDPQAGSPPTTAATTTTTTPATTTTLPVGPTTTLPVGPTTTTTTTTTTTLPPNPSYDFCTNGTSYTNDFGPGVWEAEYRNVPTFSGTPADPYGGSPDLAEDVSEIKWYYSNTATGSPGHPTINQNYFTARWTRTINVSNDCTFRFKLGGDDGYKLYVDGVKIIDFWSNHSHKWRYATHFLPAGDHDIVVEFYEKAGSASIDLQYRED